MALGQMEFSNTKSISRRKLVFWIPSVSNFANIDAAFEDDEGKLWCIHYTVSKQHPFKPRMFGKFLDELAWDDDRKIEIFLLIKFTQQS